LRVSIGDVTGSGTAFSSALAVTAATPGRPGTAVPVDAAAPCHVLTQGQLLAPGDVVRVDTRVALGDLTGTAGQAATVGFDLLVGLSSAAVNTLPATTCLGGSGTVPGAPGGG